MVADRKLVLRLMAMLSAAVALVLGGCTQGGTLSSPTQSLSTTPAGSSSPACDLITPDIAVKVDPGLAQMGQGGKPAGSPAYLCSYMSKANKGRTLSVSLTSPASAAEIVEAKQTPDCSTVAGIGDFACMQWTGWFRGEPGGASANTVLKAVRGNESLDLRIVDMPPISPEFPVPDGRRRLAHLPRRLSTAGGAMAVNFVFRLRQVLVRRLPRPAPYAPWSVPMPWGMRSVPQPRQRCSRVRATAGTSLVR